MLSRLMNGFGYSQLSNPNWPLKFVLMHVGNHRELFLLYLYYLSKGFYDISFLESITSNTKGKLSHFEHTIIFKDLMSYPNIMF